MKNQQDIEVVCGQLVTACQQVLTAVMFLSKNNDPMFQKRIFWLMKASVHVKHMSDKAGELLESVNAARNTPHS